MGSFLGWYALNAEEAKIKDDRWTSSTGMFLVVNEESFALGDELMDLFGGYEELVLVSLLGHKVWHFNEVEIDASLGGHVSVLLEGFVVLLALALKVENCASSADVGHLVHLLLRDGLIA